jgi:hypothetical protein
MVSNLADSLGMSLVAEGVETKEQAAALLLLGCSAMQGYLFARPGADPREVADEATGSGGTHTPVSEGLDRWPVALDESVLAAARLLGGMDPAHRGAVHAVSIALARSARMDLQTVRAVGPDGARARRRTPDGGRLSARRPPRRRPPAPARGAGTDGNRLAGVVSTAGR